MGFRLLIADDSQIQVESILSYVDWTKLGVTEIRTASDGKEAYDIAMEFRPHIVILDIEMPRMDGLELARNLKELGMRVKMIFISCHEKFIYAQKAMEYGGCAYILKPISYTQIESTAREVIDEINREQRYKSMRTESLSRQEEFERNFDPSGDKGEKQDIFTIQQEIMDFIELGNGDEVEEYFKQKYFVGLNHKNFDYIKYLCYSITNALQLVVKTKGVDLAKLFGNDNILWDKLAGFDTGEDIINWLTNLLTLMVKHIIELEEDKYEKLTEKIKERIDSDLYSIESVEQVTRELNVSAGHAKNVFKKCTGITIFDYLFEKRMNEAQRLLDQTDMHIYEIAEKLGYSSQAYFSIAFRKQFGMKPNDYRKGRGEV